MFRRLSGHSVGQAARSLEDDGHSLRADLGRHLQDLVAAGLALQQASEERRAGVQDQTVGLSPAVRH